LIGAFIIRLTGIEGDFVRPLIVAGCCAVVFFAVGMIGDNSIVRFLV
jgi:hypothetical protein